MKTILSKCFLYIAASLMLYSCTGKQNESVSNAVMNVSVDSLESKWDKAWNDKDSSAVIGMLDENATLLSEHSKIGKDAFIKKFVTPNIGTFGDMKTVKIAGNATNDMAFFSGSFTATTLSHDSITGQEKGLFTIIWKKQPDKNWRVILFQL